MYSAHPYRWLVVACLTGLLPLLLWQAADWTEESALRRMSRQNGQRLESYTNGLTQALHDIEVVPALLGHDRELRDLLRDPDSPERVRAANQRLEELSRLLHGAVIFLMSPQGWTVAASNWQAPDSFVGKNYGFRPYFRQALGGNPGRYVALGVTSKIIGYYASARVWADDQVLGVVVVKTDFSQQHLLFDEGAEFMVADQQGVIFLSSRPEWRFRTLQPLEPRVREQIARNRQFEGLDLRPLDVAAGRIRGGTAMIVKLDIATPAAPAPAAETVVTYLAQAGLLLDRGWQVWVLTPDEEVRGAIVRNMLAVGAIWLLVLVLVLYGLKRRDLRLSRRESHIVDGLTGLYNRRYLLDTTGVLLPRYNRGPVSGIAVLMFDIDDFQQIGDAYGRKTCDEVLIQVAGALRAVLRSGDVPVRLRDGTFMAVLAIRPGDDVRPVAERMRQRMKELRLEALPRPLTISAGVAYYHPPESLERLLERADERLRQARRQGSDQVCAPPAGDPRDSLP
ncbi:MAG: diguanylate cyclase [Candidatus Competibacter sp.]|nr:diguanylate cyclase [Candidatus Competibacter sp.]MDG4584751.1 diguanylate cyclase [Candidatus Competibacter sp.]